MKTVEQLLEDVLKVEGGYVNHPADKGGPTNFGITESVARAAGYKGDMKSLPATTAQGIYYDQYLVAPGFSKLHRVSGPVTAELFDTGVNMGTATASKFLQRAVNALAGSSLAVDGKVGPVTIREVTAYLTSRKDAEANLVKALNCLQGARYIEIVEKNNSQRAFINGWFANRVDI